MRIVCGLAGSVENKFDFVLINQYDGKGLRGLLHAHPEDVLELRVMSNTVLYDMNYPSNYQREIVRRKNM